MKPQLVTLVVAVISLGAVLYPERHMLVTLSQHPDAIAQIVGALVSLGTSFGLFVAKPHPQARAAVFGLGQRVHAWLRPRVFPPTP